MKTVQDLAPHFDYARFLKYETIQVDDIRDLISNYKEVPEVFTPRKPTLVRTGNQLIIKGSMFSLPFNAAYIKKNPGDKYLVEVFEDPAQASARFEASFGMDIEEYESNLMGEELAPPTPEEKATESLAEALDIVEGRSQSDASIILRQSLESYTPNSDKAPLLIGHTGISKSAIVNSVVDDMNEASLGSGGWGYRVVEMRSAFIDKTDFLGFVDKQTHTTPEGEILNVWTDSPKKEILACSTEFINETREFLKNTERTEDNADLYDKLKDLAKTPVLFLDEVNRAPKFIVGQLMIIINSSRVNNYDISIAPKVAAANLPVGVEEKLDPSKEELLNYLVEDLDIAAVGRFRKIVITSEDPSIISSTYKFLKKKYKGDKRVRNLLLWARDNGMLYDIARVDNNGKFPTFRGWDDLCKYLAYCNDNNITPLKTVVDGLIGQQVDIRSSGYFSVLDESDSTDLFIEHTLDSGLPMCLLGRLGIAKTAKIEKYAKKKNALVERIDLTAEDRATVNGYPEQAGFLESIVGLEHKEDTLFKSMTERLAKNPNVPRMTTSFSPHKSIVRKIEEARETGQPIVLFFDEFNRCTPSVQSAIFEAISEKRYRGVDLTGVNFSVVAAGNWEKPLDRKDYYGEDVEVDSATLMRFAAKFITEIGEEDYQSFKDYVRKDHPVAFQFLEVIGDERSREMLNYMPEEGEVTLQTPIFSFREVTELESIFLESDYDVSSHVPGGMYQSMADVIKSDRYPITAIDPEGTIDPDDMSFSIIKHLYNWEDDDDEEEGITRREFVLQSIKILESPDSTDNEKDSVMSALQYEEKQSLRVIDLQLQGAVPEEFIGEVKGAFTGLLEKRTQARSAAVKLPELFTDSKEECRQAIDHLLRATTPDGELDLMRDTIVQGVKLSDEEIPMSQIQQIVDVYNSNRPIPLVITEVMAKLDGYEHKIRMDIATKLVIDYKQALRDEGLRNLLRQYIIDPNWETLLAASENNLMYFAATVPVGKNEHVADPYRVMFYVGDPSWSQRVNHDVLMDCNKFKVNITHSQKSSDALRYEYSAQLGSYDLVLVFDNVRNSLGHNESQKVFNDEMIQDNTLLPPGNLEMLTGVYNTLAMYGGMYQNLPSNDVMDRTTFDALEKTHFIVSTGQDITSLSVSMFAKIWQRVENSYSN